jgi:hypothetical protein
MPLISSLLKTFDLAQIVFKKMLALWMASLTFAENADDGSVGEVLIFLRPTTERLSFGQRSQGFAVAFDHSIGRISLFCRSVSALIFRRSSSAASCPCLSSWEILKEWLNVPDWKSLEILALSACALARTTGLSQRPRRLIK